VRQLASAHHSMGLADHLGDRMLFREPFLGASWELPLGFPVQNLTRLRHGSEHSCGNLLGAKKVSNEDPVGVRSESLPSYAYLHLKHDYLLLKLAGTAVRPLLRARAVPRATFEDELLWMFLAADMVARPKKEKERAKKTIPLKASLF
jgi:hypothetical protein